jgi:hypothetical protein
VALEALVPGWAARSTAARPPYTAACEPVDAPPSIRILGSRRSDGSGELVNKFRIDPRPAPISPGWGLDPVKPTARTADSLV